MSIGARQRQAAGWKDFGVGDESAGAAKAVREGWRARVVRHGRKWTTRGDPVVSHGGGMLGLKSDLIFLPEHNVGAVILTNSDSGGGCLARFGGGFSGAVRWKPEAAEDVARNAENAKAMRAKFREKLIVPRMWTWLGDWQVGIRVRSWAIYL